MKIKPLLVTSTLAWLCPAVLGQSDQATQSYSVWDTIASGGWIGYGIICMSLCALALIIEHFLSLRTVILLPEQHQDDLAKLLGNRQIIESIEYCQENQSFFTSVLCAGLKQISVRSSWHDVEKHIEDTARRQSGRLYRKLEYLSFIAVSAPMLGLLGTVSGMMSAFSGIAIMDGAARSSQLASSIAEALVTTFLGLIVAIPTLFFISVLKNRIESILTEAEEITEDILRPLKKL